jgi:L-lactate dehydrogenase complex protein LldG
MMSNGARERVLANVRAALAGGRFAVSEPPPLPQREWSRDEKIDRLKTLLENMHAQVHMAGHGEWVDKLKDILAKRAFNTLVYAPCTPLGDALEAAWGDGLPPLTAYSQDIEQLKDRLFASDAGITSTRGAIAETGALILCPDAKEPRLLSLVPAVHIAVVEADKIYSTLGEAMRAEHWQDGMPTNAVLISGPSKTADIELILVFGVHGPKDLVVFILSD